MPDACLSLSLIPHPMPSPPERPGCLLRRPRLPLRLTLPYREAHRSGLPYVGSDDGIGAPPGAVSGVACHRAPRGVRAVGPRKDAS
jgi:hypothetical protein